MKKRIWIAVIIISVALTGYVGSFFLLLLGQRTQQIEFLDDRGLSYVLNYEQGPYGFRIYDHRWMVIYFPLGRPIYQRSTNPEARVEYNFYGKLVYAAWAWGWSDSDFRDAWAEADSYQGWIHGEAFPERFPDRETVF